MGDISALRKTIVRLARATNGGVDFYYNLPISEVVNFVTSTSDVIKEENSLAESQAKANALENKMKRR